MQPLGFSWNPLFLFVSWTYANGPFYTPNAKSLSRGQLRSGRATAFAFKDTLLFKGIFIIFHICQGDSPQDVIDTKAKRHLRKFSGGIPKCPWPAYTAALYWISVCDVLILVLRVLFWVWPCRLKMNTYGWYLSDIWCPFDLLIKSWAFLCCVIDDLFLVVPAGQWVSSLGFFERNG